MPVPDEEVAPEPRGVAPAAEPRWDEALVSVATILAGRGSALVTGGSLDPEFRRQSLSILAEAAQAVARASAGSTSAVSVEYGLTDELTHTGRLRAQQNLHPAESLMAAEVLFHETVPVLAEWAGALPDPVPAVAVAQALHHAIWRRFPPGAVAYADALRGRLSAAHQESRLRVSRELHDRVAHGIAAGLQRIELSTTGGQDARQHLVSAADVLRSTLEDVQTIAQDLRQLVGDRPLDRAIRDYAIETRSVPPPVEVTVEGPPYAIPAWVAEEAFLIVLEAIRNARTHAADATRIAVTIAWRRRNIVIAVHDDGSGFDRENVATGSIGLLDMRERADAIHAALEIDAALGRGTTITVTIPLHREAPNG